MKLKLLLSFGLIIILLTACNLPASTPTAEIPVPPTVQINTQAPVVVVATATSAPTISPTETVLPSPTATEFAPFTVKASVDNFNVRTNPGYLFPVLLMVQQGTELTVYGQAPGGEWIYVKTPSGAFGWVFAKLIFDEPRLSQAPVRDPEKVQIVNGFLKMYRATRSAVFNSPWFKAAAIMHRAMMPRPMKMASFLHLCLPAAAVYGRFHMWHMPAPVMLSMPIAISCPVRVKHLIRSALMSPCL